MRELWIWRSSLQSMQRQVITILWPTCLTRITISYVHINSTLKQIILARILPRMCWMWMMTATVKRFLKRLSLALHTFHQWSSFWIIVWSMMASGVRLQQVSWEIQFRISWMSLTIRLCQLSRWRCLMCFRIRVIMRLLRMIRVSILLVIPRLLLGWLRV